MPRKLLLPTRSAFRLLAGLVLLSPVIGMTADEVKPRGTLVDFAAEASRTAANDLGRATVFMETAGSDPRAVARKVNQAMAAAIETAGGYPGVNTRSGGTYTHPNYGSNGNRIESWRVRSELQLESRDLPALSELLGKLQAQQLGVSGLNLEPAPETQLQAEHQATLEAIEAFRRRAKAVADALGKPFTIKQMNIQTQGRTPVYPRARMVEMAVSSSPAPAPISAGESKVVVSIQGQIEIAP